MNQIIKVAALVGVTACVAGGVLTGVGYLRGGQEYVAQRDYNSIFDRGSQSDNQVTLEKTRLDDVKELHADLAHMDLLVQPSDDDSWYIEYTARKTKKGENPLSYSVKNGILTLQEKQERASYINIDLSDVGLNEKNAVTLYAPRNTVLETVEITQDDGDLSIDGVNCTKADWKMGYGDLALNDCTIEGGSIQLADGDAVLKKVISNHTDWIMGYGDLTANRSRFTDGRLRLDDGSIEGESVTWSGLSMTLSYGDFEERGSTWDQIALTMQDGDVDSTQLTVQGENTVDSQYGDVSVELTAESRKQTVLDLRADFGDINTYRSPAEGQNSRLTVTCADGDIDVE